MAYDIEKQFLKIFNKCYDKKLYVRLFNIRVDYN